MVNKEFFAALDALETEKHIPKNVLIDSLEAGIADYVSILEGRNSK